MKNTKTSSFIFILIIIFLIIDFVGYKLLYNNIESSHEKDSKVLFYEIKAQTSDLLSKLIYNYKLQRETLLEKHKVVLDYMNSHDLNVSLKEIHEQINIGYPDKPYDIYIADEDLIIRNTTYKMDENFDLNFAKEIFESHFKQNIIGISTPIREKKSDNFLSYTDTYVAKNSNPKAGILEVSYTYKNSAKDIADIEKRIAVNPDIVRAKAYSFGMGGFVYELMLKDNPDYKRTSEGIIAAKKKAEILSKKLKNNNLMTETYTEEGKHYNALYLSANSPFLKDVKIIYTILLDESTFHNNIDKLNFIMFLISIMGIVGILFITKIRGKELKLSEQDTFVQNAMHEIKTPLSVITLNNELREMELGKDIYSEEINAALKLLHHSYNSMGYIISKDELSYTKESIGLASIITDRVTFFQTIAKANDREIVVNIESTCKVDISTVELMQLIDNNLSNAIKYSDAGSTIEVTLHKNILSFHSYGQTIKDTVKIFDKYVRENTTVGGYGLGLSIVKEIAKKYQIDTKLHSEENKGTTFTYKFKMSYR